MERLFLSPSNHTPGIDFDDKTGILIVSGTSTPEDSFNFFQPIMNWLASYKRDAAPRTILIFKMEYFNTSSTAFILRMIKGIGELKDEGKEVHIQWFYQQDDEDLVEAGKDFGILADMPIELVEVV